MVVTEGRFHPIGSVIQTKREPQIRGSTKTKLCGLMVFFAEMTIELNWCDGFFISDK